MADRYRQLDYATLWARAQELSEAFRASGVSQGDRVLLHLPNSVAWLECLLGLVEAGALPVMSVDSLRASELTEQALASGATHILTTDDPASTVMREAAEQTQERVGDGLRVHAVPSDGLRCGPAVAPRSASRCAPEDPALVQLGGPRCHDVLLIGRRHQDYLCSVSLSTAAAGLDSDCVLLVGLSAAHNYALASPGVLGALMVGGCVVLAPDPTPSTCWPLLTSYHCTHTPLVPALLESWIAAAEEDPAGVASLRTVWAGGAPLDLDLAARAEVALGAQVQEVYGMAEALVAFSPRELDRRSSSGHWLTPISPRDEIRVVDRESGGPAAQGPDGCVRGELLARGPYTVGGFLGDPPGAQGLFDDEGWYHSGDIVDYWPSEGADGPWLQVVGRCKPQVNRGGEKIFPPRVESILMSHPQVVDAKVVGVDDPIQGQRTRATVTVVPDGRGRSPKVLALRRFLHGASVAPYYLPDEFVVCSSAGEREVQ